MFNCALGIVLLLAQQISLRVLPLDKPHIHETALMPHKSKLQTKFQIPTRISENCRVFKASGFGEFSVILMNYNGSQFAYPHDLLVCDGNQLPENATSLLPPVIAMFNLTSSTGVIRYNRLAYLDLIQLCSVLMGPYREYESIKTDFDFPYVEVYPADIESVLASIGRLENKFQHGPSLFVAFPDGYLSIGRLSIPFLLLIAFLVLTVLESFDPCMAVLVLFPDTHIASLAYQFLHPSKTVYFHLIATTIRLFLTDMPECYEWMKELPKYLFIHPVFLLFYKKVSVVIKLIIALDSLTSSSVFQSLRGHFHLPSRVHRA